MLGGGKSGSESFVLLIFLLRSILLIEPPLAWNHYDIKSKLNIRKDKKIS